MTPNWDFLNDAEIRWLRHQGFSENTLMTPTLILAANVKFLNGRTFDFDNGGERAFILIVDDHWVMIDLVAWDPKQDALATWRDAAFALGQNAIFNPASYFDGSALRVHRTPREWLRAGRDGIVILRPDLTYAFLRNVRRLSFADPTHARQVQSWIRPPRACAEILIETPSEIAN